MQDGSEARKASEVVSRPMLSEDTAIKLIELGLRNEP